MSRRKLMKYASAILGIAVLLLGVTILSFSLMFLSPGDPAETILRMGGSLPSEVDIIAKRHEMGLDRPFLVQYGSWLAGFLRGDLGKSMIDGRDVTALVWTGLRSSALLALLALLFGVLGALPLGVFTAVRREGTLDKFTSFLVFLRLSMPAFLVGLALLYEFAYRQKLFSVTSASAGWKGLVLPVATLATGICARMIRQVRTAVTTELRSPYVDGLRSRGIGELRILFRHVLKNTMLPVITLIALSFGELLGGTAVTEIIFSYPGVGSLVMDAIGDRDYTIIQGFVVLISLIFCLIYGLTELSYSLIDPRLRKNRGEVL